MLETIKANLAEQPCITFEQFFTKYVMQIQDTSIDAEMAFIVRNNFLSVQSMSRLLAAELEGWRQNDK